MKAFCCHIIFLCLCIPSVMQGQKTNGQILGFYAELAFKDARYEFTFQNEADDDELDYWKDQRQFEKKLYAISPEAHQAYLNGKHVAYGRHQKGCDDNCSHSDLYLRQASYYAVNGRFVIEGDVLISAETINKKKL